jgi:nitrogen regulatory protein PII
MKAVFIVYNQTNTERVEFLLDKLGIRGYTSWESVFGRGSVNGNPHFGSHTWPELNSAALAVVPDEKVPDLLKYIHKIDEVNQEAGIHAFVWNVEEMV